jgi:cell division transport system ATP-binding protein
MESGISISLSDVNIFQREHLVLSNVNLEMKKGELAYLLGKVGSGKSSLIKTLNAEIPLYQGKAEVAGYDLHSMKRREIPFFRRKLGVVFQDFKLLTDRTIYENLSFVLKATGWKDEKAIASQINAMLEEVSMEKYSHKMPHQLSGGEQQRVVIARALLNNPEIILADEPTGNLDPETSVQIMALFQKINQEGKTVLIASHDQLAVEKFPARTLVCLNGQLTEPSVESNLIDFRSLIGEDIS